MNKKDWLIQGRRYKTQYEVNKEMLKDDDGIYPKSKEELSKEQKILKAEIRKRTDAIMQLTDETERTILILRYVKCYSWPQIERWFENTDTPIEQRQLFRTHNIAIKNIKR